MDIIGIRVFKKEIFKSCQPDEFTYDTNDPYCIWLYKSSNITDKEYYLWVAKKDAPGYGYSVPYMESYVFNESELTDANVEWNEEGIVIWRNDLKTHLVIPKDDFTGGR
jgi:hypothetical protein